METPWSRPGRCLVRRLPRQRLWCVPQCRGGAIPVPPLPAVPLLADSAATAAEPPRAQRPRPKAAPSSPTPAKVEQRPGAPEAGGLAVSHGLQGRRRRHPAHVMRRGSWQPGCELGTLVRRQRSRLPCRLPTTPRHHRPAGGAGAPDELALNEPAAGRIAARTPLPRPLGHVLGAGRPGRSVGRTKSAIVALNLSGSSTNGSWPDCSNHTSLFAGLVNASK
jgi:hypothetical protein